MDQNMFFKTLLLVLLVCEQYRSSYQISTPNDPTYNAGVVEFETRSGSSVRQQVKDNLKRMKDIIESTFTRDLDILVFPEGALNYENWTTYVPDPARKIAPCDIPDYDYFLSELSCSARSRNLYVVVNVVEKEHCAIAGYTDTCNPSGFNKYNTNVVFDRKGRVISRYRKTHLYRYEWYRLNVRSKPEIAIFETDFGVTFGHFICFDMLFYDPAQLLLKEHNITDIIYPTNWFSELPFLTAIQLQEGWAFAHDVNLLAADGNLPILSTTGSGIFAGRLGRLNASIYEVPTTKLITATVPKHNRRADYVLPPEVVPQFVADLETARLAKLGLLRDYNLDVFTTELLDADFTNASKTVCHEQFCCSFEIHRTLISSSSMHSYYRFRMVAYDGTQTTFLRIDPSEIAVCALVACTNEELYSCGHIFPEGVLVGNKYYFASISVSGEFRNTTRRSILPSTVDGALMPLPLRMYELKEENKATTTKVVITLKQPKMDLLTFGIWCNHYSTAVTTHNLDPKSLTRGGSATIESSKLNIAIVLVAYIIKHLMS